MFLPERYRRNPPSRRPAATSPLPDADEPDVAIEPDTATEPDAWDEADELAAMPDAEFYQQLRTGIDAVRDGTVPAYKEKPILRDRPRGRRYKRRDRFGNAF